MSLGYEAYLTDSDEEIDDTSIFENKAGLADDLKFLASMPELCDITFLVGETREPVCAVKAVLAARSRVFQKMLYTPPKELNIASDSHKEHKDPAKKAASKLKAFIKRSSEPLLLNIQPQQPCSNDPPNHQTLIIEEFEPDVFRQLIEYVHTGCVTLQPRTLLGVMNAADYYGLDELKRACAGFMQCCVNADTVCALLATAERYIQYKCTKNLVQKVLEYVDDHGNEVLNLGSFALLPQHVVRLILARDELKADEFSKFQAALMWSKKYSDSTNSSLAEVLGSFLEYIHFHMIPANILMKEIHPLGLVPYNIIMNALAYQADPSSVDPVKKSPRNSSSSGARYMPRKQRSSGGGGGSRSHSVQSSSTANMFGSNTTLSSSNSSANMSQSHQSFNEFPTSGTNLEPPQLRQHHTSSEGSITRSATPPLASSGCQTTGSGGGGGQGGQSNSGSTGPGGQRLPTLRVVTYSPSRCSSVKEDE